MPRLCTAFEKVWTLLNARWREVDRMDLVGVFAFGYVFLFLKLLSVHPAGVNNCASDTSKRRRIALIILHSPLKLGSEEYERDSRGWKYNRMYYLSSGQKPLSNRQVQLNDSNSFTFRDLSGRG